MQILLFSCSPDLLARVERRQRRSLPCSERKTTPKAARPARGAQRKRRGCRRRGDDDGDNGRGQCQTLFLFLRALSRSCSCSRSRSRSGRRGKEKQGFSSMHSCRRKKPPQREVVENWKKPTANATRALSLLSKNSAKQKKKLTFFDLDLFALSLSLSFHPTNSAAAAAAAAGDDLERGHALGALQGKGQQGRGSSSSRCCRSHRSSPPRHAARGKRLLLPPSAPAPAAAARLLHPLGPARRPPPRVLPELPDPEHQDRVRRRRGRRRGRRR